MFSKNELQHLAIKFIDNQAFLSYLKLTEAISVMKSPLCTSRLNLSGKVRESAIAITRRAWPRPLQGAFLLLPALLVVADLLTSRKYA